MAIFLLIGLMGFLFLSLLGQTSDSSEDEEGMIGPVPAKGPAESSVAADFEGRARRMKEKLLGHDNVSEIMTSEGQTGFWQVF